MDFDSVEKQALGLPAKDRARLVQDLIESLDRLTPAEVKALWLDEAERRANQIDHGEVSLVTAEEVAKEARALLKGATGFTQPQGLNTWSTFATTSRFGLASAHSTWMTLRSR